MMRSLSEDENSLICSVFCELKSLNVKVPKVKKFLSRIPKQKQEKVPSTQNKVFGISLNNQEKTYIHYCLLPKFIVDSTNYLKKFVKKEVGLFRKAGSVARQRRLRAKVENGEGYDGAEPNDVASLIKQWLRELPEPLIPSYIQDIYVRCQSLKSEETRTCAVLLCCRLLPLDHLHTLSYLLKFLSDIAANSDENKMGTHNLAIVMSPNIFVSKRELNKNCGNLVQIYASVTELLIKNSDSVAKLCVCSTVQSSKTKSLRSSMELDFSVHSLENSPAQFKKSKRTSNIGHEHFRIDNKEVNSAVTANDSCESTEIFERQKTSPEVNTISKIMIELRNGILNCGNICSDGNNADIDVKNDSVKVNNENEESNFCARSKCRNKSTSFRNHINHNSNDEQTAEGKCISKISKPNLLTSENFQGQKKSADFKEALIIESKSQNQNESNDYNIVGSFDFTCKSLENSSVISNNNEDPVMSINNPKRSSKKCALTRGRPNTVKSGLPSDLSCKFQNETVLAHMKQISLSNDSDNSILLTNIADSSKENLNVSLTSELRSLNLSLNDINEQQNIEENLLLQNNSCTFDKINSNVGFFSVENISQLPFQQKKLIRHLIHCNSDTNIYNLRRKSSGVLRTNSLPKQLKRQRESPKKVLQSKSIHSEQILFSAPANGNALFDDCIIDKKNLNMSVTDEFTNLKFSFANFEKQQSMIRQKESSLQTNCLHPNMEMKENISVKDSSCETSTISVQRQQKRKRQIYCNSDSKLQKQGKTSPNVSRASSFSSRSDRYPETKKSIARHLSPRVSAEVLRASSFPSRSDRYREARKPLAGHSSPRVSRAIESACKENDPKSMLKGNPACSFKTPDAQNGFQDEWKPAKRFFEELQPQTEQDITCKRESIAMILKNKPGHVLAKINLYDKGRHNIVLNTPMTLRSKSSVRFCGDPRLVNTDSKVFQKDTFLKNKTRSRIRKALPPPPKFILPDSPKLNHPLKELTNISCVPLNVSPSNSFS